MRSLFLLCSLAVALGGCTLINAPNDARLGDGGMMDGGDGGDADADAGDGGDADAGDSGDGGDGCVDNKEICDNGADDNCNGLVDCNDFGCAQLERCCDRPAAVTLDYTDTAGTWEVIPQGGTGMPLLTGSNITDFMGGGSPTGYLIRYCLPLEAGYEISTTFRRETTDCSSAGGECFARIALTPSPGSPVGSRVIEDIGVEMTTDGSIVATQAGTSVPLLGEVRVPEGGWVKVTLTLTAGQYPDGEAAVVATVRAAFSGGASTATVLLENEPIAPRDRLLTGPGGQCDESRGLRLAVEGSGSQIGVDPIQTVALQCLNLGRFNTPENDDGPLAATGIGTTMPEGSLEWTGWGSGGVGAPSLLRYPTTGAGGWHLFGDATDLDRGEEGATPMSFRVGHSSVGVMLWDDPWDTAEDGTMAPVPRFGPECVATPCWSSDYSIREPSVIDTGSMTSFVMAAAVRVGAGDPDTYGLHVDSINVNKAIQYDPPVTIDPSDVLPADACDSLRHPALVTAGANPAMDGYWLFFTCEKELVAEPARWDIRVMKLNGDLTVDTSLTPQVVVSPAAGTFRASAVYAPEVIVDRNASGTDTYRLWYLARDQNQEVSVGFTQGQQTAEDPAAGRPATFVPYSANPILRDGPAFFDGCSDCVTTGLAVVRTSSSKLRFLFARSDDAGTLWDRRFVPAEQFWNEEATPPMETP